MNITNKNIIPRLPLHAVLFNADTPWNLFCYRVLHGMLILRVTTEPPEFQRLVGLCSLAMI